MELVPTFLFPKHAGYSACCCINCNITNKETLVINWKICLMNIYKLLGEDNRCIKEDLICPGYNSNKYPFCLWWDVSWTQLRKVLIQLRPIRWVRNRKERKISRTYLPQQTYCSSEEHYWINRPKAAATGFQNSTMQQQMQNKRSNQEKHDRFIWRPGSPTVPVFIIISQKNLSCRPVTSR